MADEDFQNRKQLLQMKKSFFLQGTNSLTLDLHLIRILTDSYDIITVILITIILLLLFMSVCKIENKGSIRKYGHKKKS